MKTKKQLIIDIITLKNGSYDKWLDMESFKGLQRTNTLKELQELYNRITKKEDIQWIIQYSMH